MDNDMEITGYAQTSDSENKLRLDGSVSESAQQQGSIDLVGGPFAVIESDPGVFTSLIRKLGIQGIEVEELYDIQSTLDQLKPKGLILCFVWSHDKHHPNDFLDPAAKNVWFANQVIDDACASLAILNVLFNCPGVELGEELAAFRYETSEMSPEMKGLAISNLHSLRAAQNSLARPADMWGSLSAVAESTRDAAKAAAKPVKKKKRTDWSDTSRRPSTAKNKKHSSEDEVETFHFIGYVPAFGKVWELDGLKSGPLEVGELPSAGTTAGWEDVVRPALRLKMEKYGAGEAGSIRFNLLALVEDRYQNKSDDLELMKRQRRALERRLAEEYGANWQAMINNEVNVEQVFSTSVRSSEPGPTFAQGFGHRKMESDTQILKLPSAELTGAWQSCVANTLPVKIAVEDEIQKAVQARTENIKRAHDYEPFIRLFITELYTEGKLAELLPQNKPKSKANGQNFNGKLD